MVARKVVSPELLAEGKSLYEETLTPVHEIWTRMGLAAGFSPASMPASC